MSKRNVEVTLLLAALCIVMGIAGSDIYHRKQMAVYKARIDALKQDIAIRDKEAEELRTKNEAEIAELRGLIDSSNFIIANQTEEIRDLKDQAADQTQEIHDLLTGEVQALIDSSLPLQRYVFSLTKQIENKDRIILTLEGRDIERQTVIAALEKQILLEREIGLSWKTQFEDQQALRIAVETSFAHYRQTTSRSKLLWTAGAAAVGLLGGAILH